MKELLIFLVLIFFIKSKELNKALNVGSTTIEKKKIGIPIAKPTRVLINNKREPTTTIKQTTTRPTTTKTTTTTKPATTIKQTTTIKPTTTRPTTKTKSTSKIISCTGGRVVGGACKCPKGYKYYNGKCTTQTPVKCLGGKISGNSCICPKKTKLINGKCIGV